jgi:histidinol-phosphate aminotransferase
MTSLPIKEGVRTLLPYLVPLSFSGIKLNQNEAPEDLPERIKEEIFKRMKMISWHRYPPSSPTELLKGISEYTGFDSAGILVGNGSNELIQTALLASCQVGDKLVTVSPTFSVYGRVAEAMGLTLKKVGLKKDFSFAVQNLKKEAKNASCIILASPNNPTGTTLTILEIGEIAGNTNALLVIDEAYFEFHKQSAQQLIEKYSNIIILRTFSKALGGAGIRLGYILGQPQLVWQLEKVKLPFAVSSFQQAAGITILRHREWLISQVETTIAERNRVFNALKQIEGIDPVRSEANFILFQEKRGQARNKNTYNQLQERGVLVRSYSTKELTGMLRVSIGTARENNLFLDAIKEIVK